MSTHYIHAVAMIRALEARLLKKQDIENLSQSGSFQEAINNIKNIIYGVKISSTANSLAAILKIVQKEETYLFHFISGLILEEDLANLIKYKTEETKIKALFKDKLISQEKKIGKEERIPPVFYQAWEEIQKRYQKIPDIKIVDLVVDAVYLRKIGEALKKNKSAYLWEWYKLGIDFYNIKTYFRLKLNEIKQDNIADFFLEGGEVEGKLFINSQDIAVEDFLLKLKYKKYYKNLLKVWQEVKNTNDWTLLEQVFLNELINKLKISKLLYDGPEPIIAYLIARRAELQNISMILNSKFYNLPQEALAQRMSISYV